MRGGAGGDIDDRHSDPRGAVRAAGDRSQPALGLDQEIVGLAIGIGAVIAVTADGAANQRRRELQNGAATACSTAMTVSPSSGSI
jgi:hypothetical protein